MPRPRSKEAHAARQEAADVLRALQRGPVPADRVADALAVLFLTNVSAPIVERYGRTRRGFAGDVLCWRDLVGDRCPCAICADPSSFDAAIAADPPQRPRVYLVATSTIRAASEGRPLRDAVGGYLTRLALAYCEDRAAKARADGFTARVFLLTGDGAQDPDEPAGARAWATYDEIKADPAWADAWAKDVDEATRGADVELHAGRGWHRLAGRPETWARPVTGRHEKRGAWYRARIDTENR